MVSRRGAHGERDSDQRAASPVGVAAHPRTPTVRILFPSPWEVEVTLADHLCHCKVFFSLLFLAHTTKRVIKTVPAPAPNLATVDS